MYYRGATAAILVYDITDANSFEDIRIWIDELKHHHSSSSAFARSAAADAPEEPPLLIYIIGAKVDLAEQGQRAVTLEYARKSLHTWYPPPARSELPSSSSHVSTATVKTTSGLSYIRPRFTSLGSSLSTPMTSPPRDSNVTNISPSSAPVLGRSRSARASPVHSRPPEGLPQPRRLPAGAQRRRWSDAMMLDDAIQEQNESDDPSTGVSGSGRSYDTDVFDDNTSLEDIEEIYPLENGMEIFEVSSKDDEGVQALFAHLIHNIIRRRNIIEKERLDRERDSVMLGGGAGRWSEDDDDTVSATNHRRGGWSCCST